MLCYLLSNLNSIAQVKSTYLYNTAMPYGTLDIRTRINASYYYYLQEGKTFSHRESAPGVRTNKYLDMTSWESNPYGQGNMRKKAGTLDQFVMNYRLLMPSNYNATFADGYPIMLLFHGAVERANCYYQNCYHSGWDYDPNTNSPAAPKTATHKLLNNDHNLSQGAKGHMDARNLAGSKLPNDPTLARRAFPGFVLVPQMMNEWNPTNVQDAIRLVQLIAQKYNIDENRIYVHGLSIGGYAVYEAMMRASFLFAAAQPISAVRDAGIFEYNQQNRVAHIPVWAYQGGTDTAPTPAYTNSVVTNLRNAGAVVRYSLYDGVGHTAWYKAFAEPEFYSWMLSKRKENIHPFKGNTVINTSQAIYPKLMLAEGFFAYQWEKNGVIISGAGANTYIAKTPGTYRARFSRVAAPTATQWNRWSAPITITSATATARINATEDTVTVLEDVGDENAFEVRTFPNPATPENLFIQLQTADRESPVQLQLIDQMGHAIHDAVYTPAQVSEGVKPTLTQPIANGMYIIIANQGRRSSKLKVLIKK